MFSLLTRSVSLIAQDIEQSINEAKNIKKQSPLSTTGSLGMNAMFYDANGIAPRRDPFYWAFNANLNVMLFNKVSVPFSAILTQKDQKYTQGLDKYSKPMNQIGISPHYKFITVHAGYRSMQFSEYTLSGALFLGGGLEIKPTRSLLSGAAAYGRFVKNIPGGSNSGYATENSGYRRAGGGAKLRYGTEQNYGEFIFLKIKDDVHSAPFDTAYPYTPEENQVMAINTFQKLNKVLSAGLDFAYSFYTKNLYEESYVIQRYTYINQVYTTRPSSQFNKAITAVLDFDPGKYKLGLRYKRIDPDYKTLGAVFLTNDVEEISVNASSSILKNKMNLSLASGFQRNNLDNIQVLSSRKVIGSVNLAYAVTEHLNLNLNYSNFSSNTKPVKNVLSDTTSLLQITENAGLSANYAFGKNKFKHTFLNTLSYMEAGGNQTRLSTFLNESVLYSLGLSDYGLDLNCSFLFNRGTNAGYSVNEGYGPNCGLRKSFLKNKLQLSFNYGSQKILADKKSNSRNITYAFNVNYTLDKHQSIKLNTTYLNKTALLAGSQGFNETRLSLAYVYNFGFKTKSFAN